MLATLRTQHDHYSNYAVGNVLNLLIQMGSTLRGYDFSRLVVRQAYLQRVDLPDVNFAQANLATSVFTDTFDSIVCVTFSPQEDLLVAGTATGELRFWPAPSGILQQAFQGHANWVRSAAFSPDGKTLASGSGDQTVRLWDVSGGQCLKVLQGHSHWVRSVAFSPDGKTLASGSHGGIIDLWDRQTGACLRTLRTDRPYERMNITQVKGITEAQRATLRLLGAIEDEGQSQQDLSS